MFHIQYFIQFNAAQYANNSDRRHLEYQSRIFGVFIHVAHFAGYGVIQKRPLISATFKIISTISS